MSTQDITTLHKTLGFSRGSNLIDKATNLITEDKKSINKKDSIIIKKIGC